MATMISVKNVDEVFLRDAIWQEGHGARPGFWGAGALYYGLTYMLRAQVAVCLGSGGGFVPRCMRQAQRDLALVDAQTVLIDAANGQWGKPNWLSPGSFMRCEFADITYMITTTDEAVKSMSTINYLHIDANHDYAQAKRDFDNYTQLLVPGGLITLHDTATVCGVPRLVDELRRGGKWDVLDMKDIGAGIAIVRAR